ncbi:MAG: hypothetical protein IKD35_00160 [Clostridia bacterium]|nr:hypothetical protein [Clostridia bacterium]
MANMILKNNLNDFQLVINDDFIIYQDLKRRFEVKFPYSNIDFVSFDKLEKGTGWTRRLGVTIELIRPQSGLTEPYIDMIFEGCFMDYDIARIEQFIDEKID